MTALPIHIPQSHWLPVAIFLVTYLLIAVESGRGSHLDRTAAAFCGAVANLIVLQQAGKKLKITFWEFARVGLIVTLVTTLAAIAILAFEHRVFPSH